MLGSGKNPASQCMLQRRISPFCLYFSQPSELEIWPVYALASLGFTTVHAFPFLQGSSLYRHVVPKDKRETRLQSEAAQIEFAKQLAKSLGEAGANVTINVNIKGSLQPMEDSKDWTEKFKNLTEALKNTLTIGASGALLLGGTIFVSEHIPESSDPAKVTIQHLDRNTQLQILPKILDAEKPEDFKEIINFIQAPPPATKPQPGRKFR